MVSENLKNHKVNDDATATLSINRVVNYVTNGNKRKIFLHNRLHLSTRTIRSTLLKQKLYVCKLNVQHE